MPFGYTKQPVKATVSDVTATRAVDGTIYRNTTGRPLLCLVCILCHRGAANDEALAIAVIGSATPPTLSVAGVGLVGTGPITDENHVLPFAVPNSYYYQVNPSLGGTGGVSKVTWIEVEL